MQYRNMALRLHQLAIFTLVFAFGDFHGQPIVNESFQLAADAARLALVAETQIYILRREYMGQTPITYPRLLLMSATRCLFCFLIVVVLFANSQEEMLLKR